ncbi:MAG: hypothetical protein IJK35_10055 [Oscillospiraceae bacterium]|nr:hypothetical protein [Oscillospiraceae bacterium]
MKRYEHKYLKPISVLLLIASAALVLWFGWKIAAGLLHVEGYRFREIYVLALLFFGYALYCSIISLKNGLPDTVKELYRRKNERLGKKKD